MKSIRNLRGIINVRYVVNLNLKVKALLTFVKFVDGMMILFRRKIRMKSIVQIK